MTEVHDYLDNDELLNAEKSLREALDKTGGMCQRYVTIVKGAGGGAGGKTKLDKERAKLLLHEMVSLGYTIRKLRCLNTLFAAHFLP